MMAMHQTHSFLVALHASDMPVADVNPKRLTAILLCFFLKITLR